MQPLRWVLAVVVLFAGFLAACPGPSKPPLTPDDGPGPDLTGATGDAGTG